MPLIPQDEFLNGLTPSRAPALAPDHSPEETNPANELYFPEQVAAAVLESPIGAPIAFPKTNNNLSNYNWYDDIRGTDYEMHPEYFIGSGSADEVQKRKSYIDIQKQIERDTADGTGLIARMAAGLVDPLTLLPGSVALKGFKGSLGIAKSLAYGAGTGAAWGGWQGKIYENTLYDHTEDDTATMVAGGAVIGGILGAGVGYLAKDTIKGTKRMLDSIIKGDPIEVHVDDLPPTLGSRSAGAGEALAPNANEAWNVGKGVWKFTHIPYMKSPIAEIMTSNSPEFKAIGTELFEHNIILNKNLEGIPTRPAVETLMKRDRAFTNRMNEDIDNFFVDYMRGKPGEFETKRTPIGQQPRLMTMPEFGEEVAKALRRADTHDSPHVVKAAKRIRAEINRVNKQLEEVATELNSLKMFTKEAQALWKTAGGQEGFSYLTRVFDKSKILANRFGMEKTIEDYLVSSGKVKDRLEAKTIAREEVDIRLGIGDEQVGLSDIARMSIDSGVKFSKERSEMLRDMPDTLLEPWLSNDAFKIANMYSSQGNRLYRVQQFLNEKGILSPKEISQLLKAEYDTALVKNPEQAEQLARGLADDVNKLNDYMSILLGQYLHRTNADRVLDNLMKYNYVTKLGGVLWSSIMDMSQPIFKMGMKGSIEAHWEGAVKQFPKVTRELVREDLNDLGLAIQRANNNVLAMLNSSSFAEEGLEKGFSIFMNKATHKFSRLALIDQWTDFQRTTMAYATESRLVRSLKNFDSLPQDEKVWLAKLGIGEREVKGILREINNYSVEMPNSTFVSKTDIWRNREMADIFAAAIIKETDSTIIMKGMGDIPRIVQRYKLAQALFQFKGYFAGFSNRTLVPALQERGKAKVYAGIMSMLAMGYMSHVIKATMYGHDIETTPTGIMKTSVVQSGIGGLLMDPMFGIILKPAVQTGRFGSMTPYEYLLGPSSSIFKNIYSPWSDMLRGEVDEKTLENLWALVPGNNLFYLRALIEAANGDKQ